MLGDSPRAVLDGSFTQPMVRLFFDRTARHPFSGELLSEWVRKAPRRHWDREHGCWVITAFGGTRDLPRDPTNNLIRAGFTIDLDPPGLHPSLANVLSLGDLVAPIARQNPQQPAMAQVRPRFAGWEICRDILGRAAIWDKDTGLFDVPLTDVLEFGRPRRGMIVDAASVAAALELITRKPEYGHAVHSDELIESAAAALAASTGKDLTDADREQIDRLVDVVGDVPDWFGVEPFAYQRLGALAALAGRNFFADPMGLGKTVAALATMAIRDTQRALVVVPPAVLTNWGREIDRAGLASEYVKPRKNDPSPDPDKPVWVIVRPGRKVPEFPHRGIIIVGDSLLSSRDQLRADIIDWGPDMFVYDEAHRARTWTSARAVAMRELALSLPDGALRLPMSGTPLFANPAELASLLAISGHLDSVFGGYGAYLSRYTKKNHFNALVANPATLPELKQTLAERVWVRRKKAEVQGDLPPKARYAQVVDVDLKEFHLAHAAVLDKVDDWIDGFVIENSREPAPHEVEEWASQQIGLISPLRKAAGLAKVPAAADLISKWIDEEVVRNADGSFTCDRPLLLWVHHHEVSEALVNHIVNSGRAGDRAMVDLIVGGVNPVKVGEIVDRFQAGQLPVLIASIHAAGVGLTLTKGSDAYFIETDWTPALVEQAEDRQFRYGQERPVSCTTLVAEGTLDARIQKVLAKKASVVSAVLGDEADVSVAADMEDKSGASPQVIVIELALEALERRARRRRQQAA